jgi:hypothetical protein
VHASDFFNALYIVSLPKSSWRVVFNNALAPLQYVGRRLAIPADRKSKHFWATLFRQPKAQVVELALRPWLRIRILSRAFEILTRALHGPLSEEANEARRNVKRVSLFHPRCGAVAEVDSRFTLGHEDFFSPSSGSYHVVRLMNAIRPQMPDSQMNLVLSAIHRSLLKHGLLVEGNGAGERIHATIFRRSRNGFVATQDLTDGSRLRSRIENFRTTE